MRGGRTGGSIADVPDDSLLVAAGTEQRTLRPEETLTFGRAADATIQLDPDDRAISRHAGAIGFDGGRWWVRNVSSSRPFAVADGFGLRTVVPPGRAVAVETAMRVVVDGTHGSHELALEPAVAPPRPTPSVTQPAGDDATLMGDGVVVNDLDRAAMVALFAGYLQQGDRYDPYPKSYAAAAARLGWPRTTLVKRIEYLRTRLTAAGVPGLTGFNALEGLAEWALTNRVVTPEHVALLPR